MSHEIEQHLMNNIIDHYDKFREKCLNELENIDNQEKTRQNELQKIITQFRSNTIVNNY